MLIHQSSSRRKSCSSCVKAKRRCDLRLPSCSRCQKRNIDCSFVRVWDEWIAEEVLRGEAPTNQNMGKEVDQTPFQNQVSSLPSIGSSAALETDVFNLDTSAVISPEEFNFNDYNFFEDLQYLDQYTGCPVENGSSMQSYFDDASIRNIEFSAFPNSSNITSLGWRTSTGLPPSLQFPTIVAIDQSQLQFGIKHFRNCIPTLLSTGHAPFIHDIFNQKCPLGTAHSKTIYQDLLTICSLQTCKTPHNMGVVNAIMNSKVLSLIASCPKNRSFLELLASVQALIIYQIIRLFDDDIAQRTIAERQSAHLYSWTAAIQQIYSAPYHRHVPGSLSPWQEWIVSESVRRTIVMSILLKSCYNSLKFGTCEDVPVLSRLPVSNKGSFWRLGEEEWTEKLEIDGSEPKLVSYKKFVQEWTVGNVNDVDDFGMALLVYCVGVSEIETGFGPHPNNASLGLGAYPQGIAF